MVCSQAAEEPLDYLFNTPTASSTRREDAANGSRGRQVGNTDAKKNVEFGEQCHARGLKKYQKIRSTKINLRRGYNRNKRNCTKNSVKVNTWTAEKGRGSLVAAFDERHTSSKFSGPYTQRRPYSGIVKFLLVVVIMGSLPGIDPSELSDTVCKFIEHKDNCASKLAVDSTNLVPGKLYCPGEFDNYMCWPHGEPGQIAKGPCPNLYRNQNNTKFGFRFCQENGSWYNAWDHELSQYVVWRHIDHCDPFKSNENETDTLDDTDEGETQLLSNFRIMYSVGYGVSLVCLVIALLLLAFFKKLHCTRNYIHMNLMISFIIRYVVILIKDSVLTAHYRLDGLTDVASALDFDQMRQYCHEYNTTGWVLTRCRLAVTLMHYAITANYFWLLAEGLYLQMLLVFVMSEHKYFAGFLAFGWGAPWISVLIWVALRMNYENSGCFDMNDEMHIWWTIRVPIIISIVINCFIFVNIVRLIVSKLQAHNMAHTDMKLRLAKSTLALIPLLGMHYIVFLALTDEVTEKQGTTIHLKLAFEMFLSSIQGTFVSVLYCFLNGEVQTEVRKAWRDWRTRKDLPKGACNLRKGSTINSANQTTQVTFFSRHSTTGADITIQDPCHNSPNSVRLELDSRANSIVRKNSNVSDSKQLKGETCNGNGILLDAKKKQIYYEPINRNNNSMITDSSPLPNSNGNETNGNIECQDNEPFLQEDIV
uniref:glucagon-like peptide 1 receptor isoform X1 n=1 Tax=Styela clava TaxID=7725 RepID=UPI00193A113C|nr:glucagon-like peptide 1 receptor isoform X1 [Styela clava]